MDSRNITEPTPTILDGSYLESMYELQKGLLNSYITIEGLPSYPLDVNSKKSQIILKDFTGRVIEELAEGFESQLKVKQLAIVNGFFQDHNGFTPKSFDTYEVNKEEAKHHIQNINEELADATHFMLELLIYTNIGPQELQTYLDSTIKEYGGFGDYKSKFSYGRDQFPKCTLSALMLSGEDYLGRSLGNNNYSFGRELIDDCTPIGWVTGGEEFIHNLSSALWDITYSLSISRNCLKNKPWKQTGMITDDITYQGLLAESMLKLMGYYKMLGFIPATLFGVYFKKNMINKFRIASKY